MTFQPLPAVTDDTAAFWEGGADGVLKIHRCRQCRTWFHPPAPVCPDCLSLDVGPEATAGRATVEGFSVNVQPWAPDMEVPYVVAVVSIDDAPGVQLTTRLVDVAPDAVSVGMPVEVAFLHVEEIYLPLFRPTAEGTS
ncbi:MAG: Zn-ribbon domain-containing OB-fold protein [Acidimicrobiia bacterium]